MNVHEYQGKEILRKFGVATPRGVPCFSVADADKAAASSAARCGWSRRRFTPADAARRRGQVAKSLDEVHEFASKILG